MYYPDIESFKKLALRGNLIPVYREILADMETPVSALMKLRNRPQAFLLESVEGGEKWGRYTFLGADPRLVFRVRGQEVILTENGKERRFPHGGDPLKHLQALLDRCRPVELDGLPRFYGGAVRFFGYEMVRFFERLPERAKDDLDVDDAVFLVTDSLIIFDNVRHTIKVVACVSIEGEAALDALYTQATEKIEGVITMLNAAPSKEPYPSSNGTDPLTGNRTPEAFQAMVLRAREYIEAGDIIQVVLSQRYEGRTDLDPIHLYRALRFINPSPYLFFLKIDDLHLIGSSPEVMVRLEQGVVELKPIAGTRPRGETEQEDRRLSDELLEDPKEKAEHVMLVDLGRNDLGRIARTGSVQVTQLMVVERYSHVMHIVSHIQAQLAPSRNAYDVLKATFPAGTLSGAPKIRAMEIIEELEPTRRGPYGGAVGYFSFTGNMDFCITIRTLLMKGRKFYIQVGAGIVADSDPEAEFRETQNKAAGLMNALALAGRNFAIEQNNQGRQP
ncbi:MAG: anthranilate synthase component I [Deltaproteobacteria bacterium]|nr:anthranilate synthase component I [Deltaproteobacteria bacterium]